jgi:hypothetical protein
MVDKAEAEEAMEREPLEVAASLIMDKVADTTAITMVVVVDLISNSNIQEE